MDKAKKCFWKKTEELKPPYKPKTVPKTLYHGTTDVMFEKYLKEGWKPTEIKKCLYTSHEKFMAEEYAKKDAERRKEKPVVVKIKNLSPEKVLRFDDDYDIRYPIGYAPPGRCYITTYNVCKPIPKDNIERVIENGK